MNSEPEVYYEMTTEEFLQDIKNLKNAEIGVLYYLRTLSPTNYRSIDADVTRIAKDLDLHRITVSRALSVLYQKGYIDRQPKEQNSPEGKVRDRLQSQLGGLTEVATPAGRIDLLTQTEIIEVKHLSEWKAAMGQVLAYSGFYPEHKKRIHLFGNIGELPTSTSVTICNELDIIVTFEEVQ